MKSFALSLVVTFLVGCAPKPLLRKPLVRPRAVTHQKKKEATDCSLLYRFKGAYSKVIIQRCRVSDKDSRVTIITIKVLDTSNNGELAINESVLALFRYFGYRPLLGILTMGRVGKHPFYMFILLGRDDGKDDDHGYQSWISIKSWWTENLTRRIRISTASWIISRTGID